MLQTTTTINTSIIIISVLTDTSQLNLGHVVPLSFLLVPEQNNQWR